MAITNAIESDLVINAVEEGDTLSDIIEFVSNNIDSWGSRQVFWDATLLDFQSIDSASIQSFVKKGAPFSEKRAGLKTAILVDSDFAYGMMRMFQIIAEGRMKIEYGVFRDKESAIEWLRDEDPI